MINAKEINEIEKEFLTQKVFAQASYACVITDQHLFIQCVNSLAEALFYFTENDFLHKFLASLASLSAFRQNKTFFPELLENFAHQKCKKSETSCPHYCFR